MIRRPIKRSAWILLGASSILLLIIGYTVLSHLQHQRNPDDTTIPTWSQMKQGVVNAFKKNDRGEIWVWEDSKATAYRLFLGLGVGVAGSLFLGMLMGCYRAIEAFFFPPLSLLAKIPPTAALAVFFVLAGTDTKMYVAMIAFGILPTLAQTVYLSVKEFPEELQFKASTLGASQAEIISTVIFPYVLPKLIDALRLVIGPAMVYLIAAEWVVGEVGFGYRIKLQSRLLNMSLVYPYLVLLAGFGFFMDYTLKQIQRKCCPWYANSQG